VLNRSAVSLRLANSAFFFLAPQHFFTTFIHRQCAQNRNLRRFFSPLIPFGLAHCIRSLSDQNGQLDPVRIKRKDFDALPFREDVKGEMYKEGQLYRDRTYTEEVFAWKAYPKGAYAV